MKMDWWSIWSVKLGNHVFTIFSFLTRADSRLPALVFMLVMILDVPSVSFFFWDLSSVHRQGYVQKKCAYFARRVHHLSLIFSEVRYVSARSAKIWTHFLRSLSEIASNFRLFFRQIFHFSWFFWKISIELSHFWGANFGRAHFLSVHQIFR